MFLIRSTGKVHSAQSKSISDQRRQSFAAALLHQRLSLSKNGSKLVVLTAVACLATWGCTSRPLAPASSSPIEGLYQDMSCDQLTQEIARVDADFTKRQKKAVEDAMIAKNCIRPLAVETE